MRILSSLLAFVCSTLLCIAGDSASSGTNKPTIHYDNGVKRDVQGALKIYKEWSGYELVVDSHVAEIHTPIDYSQAFSAMYRTSDAVKCLEKVMLDQAGIVITHLDDKRVSVTYNDALPIKNVTK
jgi:hypothetical protein